MAQLDACLILGAPVSLHSGSYHSSLHLAPGLNQLRATRVSIGIPQLQFCIKLHRSLRVHPLHRTMHAHRTLVLSAISSGCPLSYGVAAAEAVRPNRL